MIITGHRRGASRLSVHLSIPADARPGEIYPSIVNVPRPGCWQFALSWGGHVDRIDLPYLAS
jgi:hypothetical protein